MKQYEIDFINKKIAQIERCTVKGLNSPNKSQWNDWDELIQECKDQINEVLKGE